MTIALTTITGTAQTGLTSPTYTVAADKAPDVSSAMQYAITALGGTQSGVNTHTSSLPFTMTFWRPKLLKFAKWISAIGIYAPSTESNVYKVITRKGLQTAMAAPIGTMLITTEVKLPVGADQDNINVRAALSAHFGGLSQQSSGFGDLLQNNLL